MAYPSPPTRKPFKPPSRISRGGYSGAFEKKKEAPLTGIVKELKAAEGEERVARGLWTGMNKGTVRDFFFRYSPGQPRNSIGWKELDFLIFLPGRVVAASVKGKDFVHRNAAEINEDKKTEITLLTRLRNEGYDVNEINELDASKLTTQDGANQELYKLGIRV